jgi:DNA-binding CsgD family transcriptional regulator
MLGRLDPRDVLTPDDYDKAWRVIEDCSSVRSLPEFRATLLDALARHLGYRDGLMIVGPDPPDEIAPMLVPRGRDNLTLFLSPEGSVRAILCLRLCADGVCGFGLHTGRCGALGVRDVALTQLMSGTLGNLIVRCARPAEPEWVACLAERQAEAARLLARGLSNDDIARLMHVGVPTVKKYVTSILRASGCRSRAQVVACWKDTS